MVRFNKKLMQEITNLFLEIGFGENEILVYKEIVKEPIDVVFKLVQKTKLSKSSVYRAIESLTEKGLIKKKNNFIIPSSLNPLITNLYNASRKNGKIALKLRRLSFFLHLPIGSIEEIQHYYGRGNVAEQYLNMSVRKYSQNLEFGDFENFINRIDGLEVSDKFRKNRIKHAGNYSICTTFGPKTKHYCSKEAIKKYKNNVKFFNLNFKKKFIIFSDTDNHVLYINSDNEEVVNAVLVKSKFLAEIERSRLSLFSQEFGKL